MLIAMALVGVLAFFAGSLTTLDIAMKRMEKLKVLHEKELNSQKIHAIV